MPTRKQRANAIRALSMDAVQQANSGHPGMPMGMADIAEVLWSDFLRFNPANPNWPNRDRFVLSNGHGAMLLYSLLHLTGYDLSIEDLKNFRQLHSKTAGHPEYGEAPGIETTTGPLGQGLATAVGLALAEKNLAANFNEQGQPLVDHYTYVFAGDGDLMEGISHEACSLAGTWGLSKLIVFYDDNGISIDGDVKGWFTDDTAKRFEAYHWQVIDNVDGHDSEQIREAIIKAQQNQQQPTLIICKTVIGYGSPNLAGSEKTHGAPLGEEEIAATKKAIDWPYAAFEIPDEIAQSWDKKQQGLALEQDWNKRFAQYETTNPQKASEFLRRSQKHLPANFAELLTNLYQSAVNEQKAQATRKSSLACLNALAPQLPELIGGSADLSGSNCTNWSGIKTITRDDASGNYIEFGVREFAMAAIMNGLALHGGFIPYGGTFLTFSDYMRNAMRLSALMKQRVIYVLTHDSIGLGEDGPTHQPIEHATMLRVTPGIHVWRPADLLETAIAWGSALQYNGPSALLLTRQNVPQLNEVRRNTEELARGGYVYGDFGSGELALILMGTGSELHLAVSAAKQISTNDDIKVRVVSMPCADLFKEQPEEYQASVLPKNVTARLAIEAGSRDYWYQFVGDQGQVLGINQFGYSAPAEQIYQHFELTVDGIIKATAKLKIVRNV